jgi:signal transduction histidine kinase
MKHPARWAGRGAFPVMKINLSLNQKLISVTIIAFIIIIGLITVNDYQLSKRNIIRSQREKILNSSDNLKYNLMALMLEKEFDRVQNFVDEMSANPQIEELNIFNPVSGVIIVSRQRTKIGRQVAVESRQRFLTQSRPDPFTVRRGDTLSVERILPIENAPACRRCHNRDVPILGVLEIRFSTEEPLRNIRHLFINHIIFSLLGILLFSLVFWLIVIKLIDEPLDAVMEAIKNIEDGNYDKQVAIKRRDIIGRLSEKFNTMVGRINEARKEVERYHREQMKRASQMALTGEIASGIAHEIKNPLACISSALQVVERELDEKSENRPIIAEVLNQVKKLDNTVKKILEFAKPAKPMKRNGNVNNVLKDTLFFINQLANVKNIQVRTSFDPELKNISGDGKLLRQLFLNISLNGMEAMENGGVLDISTKMILREGENGGKEYAEVRITDSGGGIPPENLETIFAPFFTTKEKGTGLGLSISMQIIEEHDALLEVDSEPGRGTTFSILFPLPEGPSDGD